MTRAPGRTSLSLAMAALVVTGCFKLSRTSPPVERYVLGGAVAAPDESLQRDSAGLSIGLRRLDLAPYLSTLAIVVRRADNEIITTGFHRWAESPSAGLNRAVSGYLAVSPGIRAVDVAPWPVRAEHDYLVQLHVSRLEGVAAGGAAARTGESHLLARWEIIRPGDGALVARGATDYRSPDWVLTDYAGLVSRLDRGLVVLAKDLVACLARLGPAVPADSVAGPAAPTLECAAR
ncbi:MAG: ABC-type transport auxiliary lipoprotein family protein [Gemmatimonadaceae bacterium]